MPVLPIDAKIYYSFLMWKRLLKAGNKNGSRFGLELGF
jgi:hypothetical protein